MNKAVCWFAPNLDGKTTAFMATSHDSIRQAPKLDAMMDILYEGEYFYLSRTDGYAVVDTQNSILSISDHEQIIFSCQVDPDWAAEVAKTEMFIWAVAIEKFTPEELRGRSTEALLALQEYINLFSVGELLGVSVTVEAHKGEV